MTLTIRARLPLLDRLPKDAWEANRQLQEARDLFQLLKTTEARHVTLALSDPQFAFDTVQAELAALRSRFSQLVRDLANSYAEPERRELLRVAWLSEEAPLTSADDLVAIRAARRERITAGVMPY